MNNQPPKKRKKRAERRKRRGNSRYFVLMLFFLALIGMVYIAITAILKHYPIFIIKKIEIAGSKNLDRAFLSEISKDLIKTNMYGFSTSDLEKRYLRIKRIKSVNVSRILPSKVRIKIQERTGFFYVKTVEGNFYPVDENHIVLDNRIYSSPEDIPVVNTRFKDQQMLVGRHLVSKQLDEVTHLQKEMLKVNPKFMQYVSEYYFKDDILYFIESNTGCRVILGDNDLQTKLRRFIFLKENGGLDRKNVIDFRFQNQVVVKPEE